MFLSNFRRGSGEAVTEQLHRRRIELAGRSTRRWLRFAALALSPTLAAPIVVPSVAWAYYGSVAIDRVGLVAMFFDQVSLRRPSPGKVEVWVKGLTVAKLDAYPKRAAAAQRAIDRVFHGYKPPVTTVADLEPEIVLTATTNEELADTANLEPQVRILYNVDCEARTMRTVSLHGSAAGKSVSSDHAGDLSHVSPETISDRLLRLVCRG